MNTCNKLRALWTPGVAGVTLTAHSALEGFMKFAACIVILAGLTALAGAADARQVYVPGFYRPNGVWVAPHYRTVPDGTYYDGTAYPYAAPYAGAPGPNPYPNGAYPYGAYPNGAYPYQSPYGTPYVPPASVPNVPYYGTPYTP